MDRFLLKIYRGTPGKQYWEEFELPLRPAENVISALMAIQKDPINRKGERVTPIAWEQGCLEEVCGSCSMLVNGHPRQACTTLIHKLVAQTGKDVVTLAPFTKFPLVRDLIVDRSSMFESLKKVQGWIEAGNSQQEGYGPLVAPDQQELMYSLSNCMTCGCCLEACPQMNNRSKFIGAAAISQVRLFNAHPTSEKQKHERLHIMMEEGGISDCGNAQNCVKVCPKKIPLTDSIAEIGRDVTLQAIKDVFSFHNRE
ncbi:MAG: succinate dehydrogenase iron-sulfur subunit [Verrucomicrobia bacterium]|nr:succinate dehydrogenase iron-sulfur subunit [Verrucomicrobiota bacterium]MBS0645395.1 succinate dehydrogenase iron-sulfur subunit [Verrucomicrobiota bacterium]